MQQTSKNLPRYFSKSQAASLIFSDVSPQAAIRRLQRYINKNKEVMNQLTTMGFRKDNKHMTIKMIKYLDEQLCGDAHEIFSTYEQKL